MWLLFIFCYIYVLKTKKQAATTRPTLIIPIFPGSFDWPDSSLTELPVK